MFEAYIVICAILTIALIRIDMKIGKILDKLKEHD
jgi:hypothetical protein